MAIRFALWISPAAMLRFWIMLALLLVTVTSFSWLERYEAAGPQLLPPLSAQPGGGWTQVLQGGAIARDGDGIRLTSTNREGVAALRSAMARPAGAGLMRLTGTVRWADVETGARPWYSARVYLAQKSADGTSLWHLSHEAFREFGSGDWQQFSEVFRLSTKATELVVGAEVARVAGSLWIGTLSLQQVVERSSVTVWRWCLAGAWAAWLLWTGLSAWRRSRAGFVRLATAAIVFAILVGSLAPQDTRTWASDAWHALAAGPDAADSRSVPGQRLVGPAKADGELPFAAYLWRAQKLGHFGLFAALALAVGLLRRGDPLPRLFLFLAGFALVAESLQLLTFDRDCEFADAAINLAGVTAGVLLAAIWRRYSRDGAATAT